MQIDSIADAVIAFLVAVIAIAVIIVVVTRVTQEAHERTRNETFFESCDMESGELRRVHVVFREYGMNVRLDDVRFQWHGPCQIGRKNRGVSVSH